jgi:hypothetical protein
MSLATSNRDGGRTSESGHLRAIQKAISGEVLTGLAVSQRGAGANMSVDIAIGDCVIPRSDGTYGHPAWNDAVYNQVIAVADVSNPRRDIVVMYIDYSVTPSTGVSNNTNGVVKISVVAGTPAGSPVDPSDAAIQSAVGASNPFIKLARVRVAAGATSITNSVIDDLRIMAQAINNGGWQSTKPAVLTYTSFSSATGSGVVATDIDLRSTVQVGHRIAFWQLTGGWKYGIIHAITASTITVFFGQSYTLNNEAIYISKTSPDYAPMGFDPDPNIWKVEVYDATARQGNSPAKATWYVPSGSTCNITLDPGKYIMGYEATYRTHASAGSTYITSKTTISTTTNTETDVQFTAGSGSDQPTVGVMTLSSQLERQKVVTVAAQTTYRLLAFSDCGGTMGTTCGFQSNARIYAYSAYIAC